MTHRAAIGALVAASFLAACTSGEKAEKSDPDATGEIIRPQEEVVLAPEGPAAEAVRNAPHVYMALQPGGNGPTSVVFAIDQSQDKTPTNDPAIRITPENGQCNPQQLRGYSFDPRERQRPIYGPDEVLVGIEAKDLPNFMAMAVTSEMMRTGLVVEPEASKPQNVCTRKLFEQLIVQETTGQG